MCVEECEIEVVNKGQNGFALATPWDRGCGLRIPVEATVTKRCKGEEMAVRLVWYWMGGV